MNGLKHAVIMMLFIVTSVLAAWSEARALSFSFQINRFQVNQGGMDLVNDSFDDGREPPIGRPSDDDACAATNSCRYRTPTIGTFGANDETGGSLTLNDIGGDIGTSSSGVRRVRKGAQLRRRIRQIPVGSEVAEGFFVEADFAGTLPRDTLAEFGLRESYRIQLIDSGTGGTFDDSVILEVANAGGVPRIRFRDVSGGETLGDLFPGPLSSEITLRLNVDASGNVTASFDANGSAGDSILSIFLMTTGWWPPPPFITARTSPVRVSWPKARYPNPLPCSSSASAWSGRGEPWHSPKKGLPFIGAIFWSLLGLC